MRIEVDDRRERLYENLMEATGESYKSTAIDTAARFFIRMRGGTTAVPRGALVDLLAKAEDQGAVTGEEIVDVLSTRELPLRYSTSVEWGVGDE